MSKERRFEVPQSSYPDPYSRPYLSSLSEKLKMAGMVGLWTTLGTSYSVLLNVENEEARDIAFKLLVGSVITIAGIPIISNTVDFVRKKFVEAYLGVTGQGHHHR